MEARHRLPITVTGSDKLAGANFVIEKGTTPSQIQPRSDRGTAVNMDWGFEGEGGGQIDGEESTEAREDPRASATDAEGTPRRRRRRRRRGSRQGDQSENELMSDEQLADDAGKDEASEDEAAPSIADAEGHSRRENEEECGAPRSRRRGRRGGRRVRQAKAGAEESRPDPMGEQPEIDASVFNAAPNDESPFGAQPVDAENERPPKSAPKSLSFAAKALISFSFIRHLSSATETMVYFQSLVSSIILPSLVSAIKSPLICNILSLNSSSPL